MRVCGSHRANVAFHPSPRQMGFLATPFEHPPPDPTHCHAKVTDRHGIHRHRIVMHMAENNRAHIGTHLGDGLVHTPTKLGLNLPKLRLPPRAHRLPKHREPSLARLSTAVSKSQEVEGLGLTLASALPVFLRTSAELNQARLFAMKFQPKRASLSLSSLQNRSPSSLCSNQRRSHPQTSPPPLPLALCFRHC